jgi:hypothetical protein
VASCHTTAAASAGVGGAAMRSRRMAFHLGPVKAARWRMACHEAGHGIAFATLCHVRAVARIYRRSGGDCGHGRIPDHVGNEAFVVSILAGAAAEWVAMFPPHKGRWHGCRDERDGTDRSDAASVATFVAIAPEVRAVGQHALEVRARRFVEDHVDTILAVARKLYRRGKCHVPAMPAERTVQYAE